MFIDLFRTELVAGYCKVKNYRPAMLSKWRFKLLRAYTQRWEIYAKKRNENEMWQQKVRRFLRWMGIILVFGGLTGCLLVFTQFWLLGFLLFGSAMTVTLLALALWGCLWIFKPRPPENPLVQSSKQGYASLLKNSLFPDLVPAWRLELEDPIPFESEVTIMAEQTQKWGLIGEFGLVRKLANVISSDTVILHSVMPKPRDDMDVVVIGPKGIWYFEVKYENAEFNWQNNKWQICKYNHEKRQWENVVWSEYPDAQWYRMRAEALNNLRANAQKWLTQYPNAGKINGGIVFAHPKVVLNIQKSPPFAYGNPGGWLIRYRSAPNLPGMTPEIILRLTEILLTKHQSFNSGRRINSMNAYADTLIHRAEQNLKNWVANP